MVPGAVDDPASGVTFGPLPDQPGEFFLRLSMPQVDALQLESATGKMGVVIDESLNYHYKKLSDETHKKKRKTRKGIPLFYLLLNSFGKDF